ncbi:EF-hand domain-containing protein [Pseudodesulfovibrio thermohalotolerans]|jgi:urate oxidase|uniref:EF-hand domain-containing protein n=1 Tax=Pseudodesulfovibrio thermohalotolerans TaxID=2880651 RepID=UPI002441D507|nr:EF-hand domain-containing protein [Pseudodesulfovibrio thermohalotolerans]WFS62892.1 EF-hand domain-containing protein [Pseudodesulfovibrio thermohalotolerans]
MKKLFLALAFALLFCQPVAAKTNYNVCFQSLDVDVDGRMSKGEFLVAFSDGDTSVFDQADSDKNGSVSHEEWEAYKEGQGFESHE